jgi:hypothetical protein
MSRDILAGLGVARIPVASATYEVEGLPPLKAEHTHRAELQLQRYHTLRPAQGRRTAACVCPVRRLISPRSRSRVAQLVEQVTVNHRVGGSSPSSGVPSQTKTD